MSHDFLPTVVEHAVIAVKRCGFQVYMLEDDERDFVEAVRGSGGDVVLIALPWSSDQPRIIDRPPEIGSKDPWGASFILWNRSLGGGFRTIRINQGAFKGQLNVNEDLAPALILNRSRLDQNRQTLTFGSITAVTHFQLTTELAIKEKPKPVLDWFEQALDSIKKHCVSWERRFKVGRHADLWRRKGGKLV